MELLLQLLATLLATVRDVAPIVAILVFFQFVVLRRRPPNLRRIALGVVYVVLGLALFLVGLDEALFPIGRTMADQLSSDDFVREMASGGPAAWQHYGWVYAFAAAIGFSTTVAEPALIAVSLKAQQVSGGAIRAVPLRMAVACGVAAGVAIGAHRIVVGAPLPYYIIAGYVIVMLQTLTAPKIIIPLAYDSGGVTTSTVTVPVVTALGLGLASTIPGRSTMIDGFGLIAFASLCPIMAVLSYAWTAERLQRRRARRREAAQ
ncbi:MAG: DUF1538 domain-containing protein [Rhodospirillales bacterium]|nr:DUF1538 domain-containing protein [Rhodospirillales bacterium]